MMKSIPLIVLQCTLCLCIRVPVNWSNDSEINNEHNTASANNDGALKTIPKEYFEYTATKPQFAVDIAAYHGVPTPENHFSAYPVKPYTDADNLNLGHHHLLDPQRSKYYPYQRFINKSQNLHYIKPTSTSFDIYHPYKAEEPALQQLYKDPVLDKIKNDLRNSKNRLHKYENDAGEPSIDKDEYLESPDQIDNKHTVHKNEPAQFEVHKPLRRPIYYRAPPKSYHRENILNHKFKHPWNQNFVKVTPKHYRPVKHHLQRLRQQHAIKYDDEKNEYPQLLPPESYADRPDGYDIYEKGKSKFIALRNNVDESINKAALESKPGVHYDHELRDDNTNAEYSDDSKEEFVPIKNYAQVRKTETTKHHPREKAFEDAENFEEYLNAPRLREAIKSTKAQIVYSEEGYEDSAYDHAGERKHASDHEGHGGHLKENELSKGKYKIPSVSTSYDDAKGSEYRDQVLHGEKWKNDDKNIQDERDLEDYSDDDHEDSEKSDIYSDNSADNNLKIESSTIPDETPNQSTDDLSSSKDKESKDNQEYKSTGEHEVNKRETSLADPGINLNSRSLKKDEIPNSKTIITNKSDAEIKLKYPYYFQKGLKINKDSPLRYAEDLKHIPNKTQGGTEFYDSRSKVTCSEVEDEIDPVPEKLKKGENPEDDKNENFHPNNTQRLKKLGDKIDCFKAKYFGQNPLDSPFFDEEIISNPSPIVISNLNFIKTNINEKQSTQPASSLIRRTKRSTSSFIYEPYKIIREGQSQDSKKTTTLSNISPLIKLLQSSRVIDKTHIKQNKDQAVKKNSNFKVYKDINKNNRSQILNNESDIADKIFEDISVDHRRGEPRYEIKHPNHKTLYTPVENKTTITLQDYKDKMEHKNSRSQISESKIKSVSPQSNHTNIKRSNVHGLQKHIIPLETQNVAASNTVNKIIRTTTEPVVTKTSLPSTHTKKDEDKEESDYEEYDDDDEEENSDEGENIVATTTTTTRKPISRRKITATTQRTRTIADKSLELDEIDYIDNNNHNKPKLQLVTRFRNPTKQNRYNNAPAIKQQDNANDSEGPKIREKKKKLTKSTIVTDTKSYGEGSDDMRKEDIDAMIGVKAAIDEYMPTYEKKMDNLKNESPHGDDDFEEYDDDDEEDDDKSSVSVSEEDDEYVDSKEIDEDESKSDEDSSAEDDDKSDSDEIYVTTPEPTKRTLLKTTEKASPTTESTTRIIETVPKVLKKKIEIHKVFPVAKSFPNLTDIKEVEIIKEIPPTPRRKNKKNTEVLELYKDVNLAKDVNKLGGVEIFKENLDIKSSPRHGGNYRSLESQKLIDNQNTTPGHDLSHTSNKTDVEASQSESKKLVDFESPLPLKLRDINHLQHTKKIDNLRNSKIIELTDHVSRGPLHGGNLKHSQNRGRTRHDKNAKFIELDDEDDEETVRMHGGNFKTHGSRKGNMHGGNYRSAKIVQSEGDQVSVENIKNRDETTEQQKNNAVTLLNGYARAVPILTTTPVYILDPSKRKYYYVDT